MSLEEAKRRREELLATAPRRENYPDDDSFAESRGRWQENQGRNIAFIDAQIRSLEKTAVGPAVSADPVSEAGPGLGSNTGEAGQDWLRLFLEEGGTLRLLPQLAEQTERFGASEAAPGSD